MDKFDVKIHKDLVKLTFPLYPNDTFCINLSKDEAAGLSGELLAATIKMALRDVANRLADE